MAQPPSRGNTSTARACGRRKTTRQARTDQLTAMPALDASKRPRSAACTRSINAAALAAGLHERTLGRRPIAAQLHERQVPGRRQRKPVSAQVPVSSTSGSRASSRGRRSLIQAAAASTANGLSAVSPSPTYATTSHTKSSCARAKRSSADRHRAEQQAERRPRKPIEHARQACPAYVPIGCCGCAGGRAVPDLGHRRHPRTLPSTRRGVISAARAGHLAATNLSCRPDRQG